MERRQTGLPRPTSAAVPSTPAASTSASASRFGFRAPSTAATGGAPLLASALGTTSAPAATTAPSTLRRSVVVSGLGAMSGSAVKRTASQAGMPSSDTGGALGAPATRRALVSSTSATAAPSSPYDAPIPSSSSPSSGASTALISELERKLLVSSASYERLELSFRELGAKLDRLERERLELLRAWEENQEERKVEKKSWEDERLALNAQLSALRADKAKLSERNMSLETEAAQLHQSSRSEASNLKVQNARLEAEVEALKAELEREKARGEVYEKEKVEREREWDEEKARLIATRGDDEESRKVAEELNRQMSHIRTLESDLSRLRTENERLSAHRQSVEVLKEEKSGLEHKLRGLEETRRKLEKAELRCDEMEGQRRSWTERLEQPDSASYESAFALAVDLDVDPETSLSPDQPVTLDTLPNVLSLLRGGHKGLQRRAALLQQRYRSLQTRVEQMEQEEERRDKEILRITLERDNDKEERMRAERKAEMHRDEAARYRQIYETYETEAKNHAGSYDAASAERISTLEARLSELTSELEAREVEAQSLRERVAASVKKEEEEAAASGGGSSSTAATAELREKVTELSAELERSQAAVASLSSQLDKEADRASRFEMRLGRGEYDASQERVLEMKLNPVSKDLAIRSSTLETYRRENETLRQRIAEILEKGGASSSAQAATAPEGGAAATAGKNEEASNLELVKELRATIETKDKVLLRLRQTFGAKAKEYRETFESLFGFKIKYLEDGRVRLVSVFARSKKGTTLLFSSDEGDVGKMRLHGEALEGMANVKRLKEYWLGAQQSVPCFLAALQLELYENTTRALRGGWVVPDEDEE